METIGLLNTTRQRAALVLGGVALVVAGCGGSGSYKNDPRPPAPIVLTAAISKDRVSVSPSKFGAGPVSLVITNLTDTAQQVIFETNNTKAGVLQQTGPINPRDTATLKVNAPSGGLVVRVEGDAIKAAKLAVGPSRPSAQNQLLQP
jgi:hypothetical protein